MSTPFSAATTAYGNISRLVSDQASGKNPLQSSEVQGADFGQMLADQVDNVGAVGKVSDKASIEMVNGNADVVDVVTALAETESTMETMVTVRDRVISAYEEIMRMPI